MRSFWLMLMVCLANAAFAQRWEEVAIDDNFAVELPETYFVIGDRDGQRNWLSDTIGPQYGVQRKAYAAEHEIGNESELRAYYQDFMHQYGLLCQERNITLLSQEVIVWKGLLGQYGLAAMGIDGLYTEHEFMYLVLEGAEYTFSVTYDERIAEDRQFLTNRARFFECVNLGTGIGPADQYMHQSDTPALVGSILPYLLFAGLVSVVIIVLRRMRTKSSSSPKAIPPQNNV